MAFDPHLREGPAPTSTGTLVLEPNVEVGQSETILLIAAVSLLTQMRQVLSSWYLAS